MFNDISMCQYWFKKKHTLTKITWFFSRFNERYLLMHAAWLWTLGGIKESAFYMGALLIWNTQSQGMSPLVVQHASSMQLTHLVPNPKYDRRSRSISWLLMPPGSLRRQNISSHGIGCAGQMSSCLPWGKISTTCVISDLRTDRKYKNLCMSPKSNTAQQGLMICGSNYGWWLTL